MELKRSGDIGPAGNAGQPLGLELTGGIGDMADRPRPTEPAQPSPVEDRPPVISSEPTARRDEGLQRRPYLSDEPAQRYEPRAYATDRVAPAEPTDTTRREERFGVLPVNSFEPVSGQERDTAFEAELSAGILEDRERFVEQLGPYHDDSGIDTAALREYAQEHGLPDGNLLFVHEKYLNKLVKAVAELSGADPRDPEVQYAISMTGGGSLMTSNIGYVVRKSYEEKKQGTVVTEGKAIHEMTHLRRGGSHIVYDTSGPAPVADEWTGLRKPDGIGAAFEEVSPEANFAAYMRQISGSPNGMLGGAEPRFTTVNTIYGPLCLPDAYIAGMDEGAPRATSSSFPAAGIERLMQVDPSLLRLITDVKANGEGAEALRGRLDAIRPDLFADLEACTAHSEDDPNLYRFAKIAEQALHGVVER